MTNTLIAVLVLAAGVVGIALLARSGRNTKDAPARTDNGGSK